MTATNDVIEHRPQPAALSWVDAAKREIDALQEAAKADPKTFFGNRVRGMGDGLTRVKALLYAAKDIEQALSQLNRVL